MMHASDAAALFCAADEDELEENRYDIDGGEGDEQDVVNGWDSKGDSSVDDGDPDMVIPVRYLPFLKEEFY